MEPTQKPRTRLAATRGERGLTQEQLALLAGVSAAAISYIESGKRTPSYRLAGKIAKALRVKSEHLFPELFEEIS